MNVEFHPAAQQELTEAVHFFESQQQFLGERLLSTVEETLTRIKNFPNMFPEVDSGIRQCKLARFPYIVVYRVIEEKIQILALPHVRQKPKYWQTRA